MRQAIVDLLHPPRGQAEILGAVLAAKRYTFIESGLMHPSFRELFSMIPTRAQRQRVEQALGATLTTAT
jgi:hypothetical protein